MPSPLLLFLDFDGVTHPYIGAPMFHAPCMAALHDALDGFEIEIVVSSTWRKTNHRHELEAFLAPLGKPLQGVTPVIERSLTGSLDHRRYREVERYLADTGQEAMIWLAVDDTVESYPADAPVYWTNPATGFTTADIRPLRQMLASLMND